MKKKSITAMTFLLVMVVGFSITYAVNGGTQEDPIVTKSYVDSAVAFKPIELKKGQSLLGGEGCEIVVRSGFVTALCPTNNLSDVTDGKEIRQGFQTPANHLLLVAREDGRGVKAQEDAWIIVKGTYKIQ